MHQNSSENFSTGRIIDFLEKIENIGGNQSYLMKNLMIFNQINNVSIVIFFFIAMLTKLIFKFNQKVKK